MLRKDAIPTIFAHRAPIKRRKPPAVRYTVTAPDVTAPDVKLIIREHSYTGKGYIGRYMGTSIYSYISY